MIRKSSSYSLPPSDPGAWPRYLGRKISIRHRLHDDPDHEVSEAIGVVSGVSDTTLSILTRKGDTVTIALVDVIAGKVFP